MKGSDYWEEHAGHVSRAKCQRENKLQGIKLPPWYFLYWSNEHQGLRSFNPLDVTMGDAKSGATS